MLQNWKTVWDKREIPESTNCSTLEALILCDGFDSPLGIMNETDWRNYIQLMFYKLEIEINDSVFEIGCGAGAFLYPFYEKFFKIGGIDISKSLIDIAKIYMPEFKFHFLHKEAIEIETDFKYDVILANHVFHYFPSKDYAKIVLEKMFLISNKVISITGLPDFNLMIESENFRRGLLSEEEYKIKYVGLDILYFSKEWFIKLADLNNYNCIFQNHTMPGFAQNKYRFDCIFTKKLYDIKP